MTAAFAESAGFGMSVFSDIGRAEKWLGLVKAG
jgi:hypothetical protein